MPKWLTCCELSTLGRRQTRWAGRLQEAPLRPTTDSV